MANKPRNIQILILKSNKEIIGEIVEETEHDITLFQPLGITTKETSTTITAFLTLMDGYSKEFRTIKKSAIEQEIVPNEGFLDYYFTQVDDLYGPELPANIDEMKQEDYDAWLQLVSSNPPTKTIQ